MNLIKINYEGGYRQASKYLTWKHDANLAIIIDAMIYIYNENLDKLVSIEEVNAVKISNAYLSRNTGLSLDIVKRNVALLEKIGLITAIKKGQGNTRHYVILTKNINTYIKALKKSFDDWFNKSLSSSRKEKSRSKKHDQEKLNQSKDNFAKTLKDLGIPLSNTDQAIGEIPPTQTPNNNQPKVRKAPVANKKLKNKYDKTTIQNGLNVVSIESIQKNKRIKYDPAPIEKSEVNWKLLELEYNKLPELDNQGKFFPSAKDKNNFFNLDEARQLYIINKIKNLQRSKTTASRPQIYIQTAMTTTDWLIKSPEGRLNVAL